MTLCEIKRKDFSREIDKIQKMVNNPEFICKKCLRSASKKKFLCKPSTIDELAHLA